MFNEMFNETVLQRESIDVSKILISDENTFDISKKMNKMSLLVRQICILKGFKNYMLKNKDMLNEYDVKFELKINPNTFIDKYEIITIYNMGNNKTYKHTLGVYITRNTTSNNLHPYPKLITSILTSIRNEYIKMTENLNSQDEYSKMKVRYYDEKTNTRDVDMRDSIKPNSIGNKYLTTYYGRKSYLYNTSIMDMKLLDNREKFKSLFIQRYYEMKSLIIEILELYEKYDLLRPDKIFTLTNTGNVQECTVCYDETKYQLTKCCNQPLCVKCFKHRTMKKCPMCRNEFDDKTHN